MTSSHSIIRQLQALAEPSYRDFAASLIPGGMPLLGVRLPALRQLARQLAKDTPAWQHYLSDETTPHWMEETMLRGMLPGYIRDLSLEERLDMLERFVPLVTNWSICDSCCATYRFMRSHRETVLPWLQTRIRSRQQYTARLGIVCLLMHYLPDPAWAPHVAESLAHVQADGYYAIMAAAWCCCELYLRYPELGTPLLQDTGSPLPDAVRHKAAQKIRESHRHTPTTA